MVIVLSLISTILLGTFPGLHTDEDGGSEVDVRPFPSLPVSQVSFAASLLAVLPMFVSILWQHTASVASTTTAEKLGYGPVKSEVGEAAMALGWTGLALICLAAMGQYVMVRSIMILKELTHDQIALLIFRDMGR